MPRARKKPDMPIDILSAFNFLSQGYVECPVYDEKDKNQKAILIQNILDPWHGAFYHFVDSQWENGLKFPGDRVLKQATKPRGILLVKLYELCKEVHALQGKLKKENPWTNAYDWFNSCIWCLVGIETQEALQNNLRVYNHNYKQAVIERRMQKIRLLREGVNPYENFQNAIALNLLIDSSLELSSYSQFNKKYWKPFLAALSAEANELKSDRWNWARFEKGVYRQTTGKGRPKKLKSVSTST